MGQEVFHKQNGKCVPSAIEVGELTGWRIWKVNYDTLSLHSYSVNYAWQPGINESADMAFCHIYGNENGVKDYPSANNDVGFYAFKQLSDLLQYLNISPKSKNKQDIWYTTTHALIRDSYGLQVKCFGMVSLWGQVTEADLGYRAQFAEIKGLLNLYTIDAGVGKWVGECKLIRRLRAKYNVPDMRE